MFDIDHEQTESANLIDIDETEPGFVHIAEVLAEPTASTLATITQVETTTPISPPRVECVGTVEHLAARQPFPILDPTSPEIKQRLAGLRTTATRLLTDLRWDDLPIDKAADQLVPLLDIGPVQQWKAMLVPFLHEIDRGGAMIPVWLYIIGQGDPTDLSDDTNPAETTQGRARRFAILMLGNYRIMGISSMGKPSHLPRPASYDEKTIITNVTQYLGYLSTDPNTSLYATEALVKHATVPAMQSLIGALQKAQGWAKVDVVNGCVALQQEDFYPLLLVNALDDVAGLESYIAIPLYRAIPLENYLHNVNEATLCLAQNAALIFNQILLVCMTPPTSAISPINKLPVIFERHLSTLATALFAEACSHPHWKNIIAVHHLGLFLGHYWSEISRQTIKDARIIEAIYHCLPMMNEVESWMAGTGRAILLDTLSSDEEEAMIPVMEVLGEVHDLSIIEPMLARLAATNKIRNLHHALMVATICDTLGKLGDPRAVAPILQLVHRSINVLERTERPRREHNLPTGDTTIPDSIVYAAAIYACGQLADRRALADIFSALNDFDPHVRSQALKAVLRLDPAGEDERSRAAVRGMLHDPQESIIQNACQIITQYQDIEARPLLTQLAITHPELADLVNDTLHRLEHTSTQIY